MYVADKLYWKSREELIKFRFRLRSLAKDEEGAETLEYAVVIALAAVLIAVVAGIIIFIKNKLDNAQGQIEDVMNALPTPGAVPGSGSGSSVTGTPAT